MKRIYLILCALFLSSCFAGPSIIPTPASLAFPTPIEMLTPTMQNTSPSALNATETNSPAPTYAYAKVSQWDYNPVDWAAYDSSIENFPSTQYEHIAVESDGTVWVLASGLGVVQMNQGNWKIIEPVDPQKGIPSSISLAENDGVWIGYTSRARSGMLSHFKDGKWTDFKNKFGLINAIAVTERFVWIATDFSTWWFDRNEWNMNRAYPAIDLAATPTGEVWAALPDGLGFYDGNEWSTYSLSKFNCVGGRGEVYAGVTSVAYSTDGNSVWFATVRCGLFHFYPDADKWDVYLLPSSVSDYPNNMLVAQDGVIWMTPGIFCFDGSEWKTIRDFPAQRPLDIAQGPDGSLWIATLSDGIYQYKNPKCGND